MPGDFRPMFQDVCFWKRTTNAVLYIARQISDGRSVVLKTLPESASVDQRKRFLNEIRVMTSGHPGLVKVHHAYTGIGCPYYTMEIMASTLLPHCGRLTIDQLYYVAIRCASALASIHSAFGLHGDPKPDNLHLDHAGAVFLADPIGNLPIPSTWFRPSFGGTPGYRAPEVRVGQPISRLSDTYSFGATLFHLITGVVPFDGQRIDLDIQKVLIDVQICETVARCCQQEASKRPGMADVTRALGGETWLQIDRSNQLKTGITIVGSAAIALIIANELFGDVAS